MLDLISISDCNKFIQVMANKESEIKDVKETIKHVMSIYKANGIDKVFIDARDRDGPLTTTEYLDVATFLTEITAGQIKFSVLINDDVSNRDFFKSAVSLKGGLISYFNDKTSALVWLNA